MVRAKVDMPDGSPRFAGGVFATGKAVITSGKEVVSVELTAVAACRNGMRVVCLCIN